MFTIISLDNGYYTFCVSFWRHLGTTLIQVQDLHWLFNYRNENKRKRIFIFSKTRIIMASSFFLIAVKKPTNHHHLSSAMIFIMMMLKFHNLQSWCSLIVSSPDYTCFVATFAGLNHIIFQCRNKQRSTGSRSPCTVTSAQISTLLTRLKTRNQ